ncbi:PfkB family carbohydrate kinase [Nocardiopsis coralliicola]
MITVCGEALIDFVPGPEPGDWRALPGGGAANAAVALARLGAPAPLLCRLSGDHFGRTLRDHLADSGVDLGRAVQAGEQSTLAFVAFDAAGSAEYTFYRNGTADFQWRPEELPDDTAGSCVHVGTLAAVLEPGAAVLRDWLAERTGTTAVCYDANVRPDVQPDRTAYRASAAAWCDTAHILKASADDLAWLYPGTDPVETAAAMLDRHRLRLAVVTLGGDGAVGLLPGRPPIRVPAVPVDVVDTVGAGDAFIAAVLAALDGDGLLDGPAPLDTLTPGDVTRALDQATRAAALACTRAGAQPPTRAELDAAFGGGGGGAVPAEAPAPVRDLGALLAGLQPELHPGTYVHASAEAVPPGVRPVATFAEAEGLTLVCTRGEAEAAGLDHGPDSAWITLRVHSALDAVGLTAAVASALADAGLSSNVLAGYHHDHLFVPRADGRRAVELLERLSAEASPAGETV